MEAIKTWLTLHAAPILLMICALSAIGIWRHYRPEPVPPGQTVIATPSPEVAKVDTRPVEIKAPVKVYKGGAALKNGLKLPAPAVQNDNIEVLASSKVTPDDHPHTITTTIDAQTGETVTYDRTDPLPWLALDYHGEVGVYVGEKASTRGFEPTLRIEAKQGLAQIKAVHVGAIASVDAPLTGGDPDAFIGLGGWYRW